MAWECVEGITCSRCGEKGHLQRNCKNVSCHKCGRKGHISKFCKDPFVKAEELERDERQQAIYKSRIAFSQGSGKDGLASFSQAVSMSTSKRKTAPGPWDGLGDRKQHALVSDAQASSVVGATVETGTKKSQGVMHANVKILTVKRKIYTGAELNGSKRRNLRNCNILESDGRRQLAPSSPCTDTLKVEEPPEWSSLLGYSSEESRDDGHTTSDRDCEEESCKYRELSPSNEMPDDGHMERSGIQPSGE